MAALVVAAAVLGNSAEASRILFLSNRDGDWALYAMDSNGRHEHRVFSAGDVFPSGGAAGHGDPVVSPDGRKVLLARRGITVATIATGASKRVAAGEESDAAWSPDSRRIVFSGRTNGGLYVVDVDTGRRRTLLRKSQTWSPAWSPDSQWIAFARQIGYGPMEVYVVHADGSGLKRVSDYGSGGTLAWSRSSDRLAFIGSHENEEFGHLIVVDVRRERVDVLQSRLGGGTATWSPDGQTIAYDTTIGNSQASAIYTIAPDGSGLRRLTRSPPLYSDESPIWSPDGTSLVFIRTPVGGGAERYLGQVWTMSANGSNQRPLTRAFPDGGDNIEPAWIRGAVYSDSPRRPQEIRRGGLVVLRVPFAVDGISADGAHAAIASITPRAQQEYQPTPPVLFWRPGDGEPAHLLASSCGTVQGLVLTGNRLAFDCNNTFLDELAQSLWVVGLRTRIPREVFFARAGDLGGMYLNHIVGRGGLLAFGSERESARVHATGVRTYFVRQRALWRIDGFDSIALRVGPQPGDVVATDGGRLALELANGRIAIARADGALLRVLSIPRRRSVNVAPFGGDPPSPFLFAGRDLLLLEQGTLSAYDSVTGARRWQRRVPGNAQLEGADGRLVVYTAGSSIHVLSRETERVVHTGAPKARRLGLEVQRRVHAALTASGLFYCFNVADRDYPGRVVFVPRTQLERAQL